MERVFFVSWDDDGLDLVADLTSLEEEKVFAILANNKFTVRDLFNKIISDGRFKSQKNYTIYTIKSDFTMSTFVLIEKFSQDFLSMKTLIEQTGFKIYG